MMTGWSNLHNHVEDLVRAVDDPNHLGAYRGTLSSLFNAETLRRSGYAPVGPEALMMTAEEFSDIKPGGLQRPSAVGEGDGTAALY
jgi:hypothetical protein